MRPLKLKAVKYIEIDRQRDRVSGFLSSRRNWVPRPLTRNVVSTYPRPRDLKYRNLLTHVPMCKGVETWNFESVIAWTWETAWSPNEKSSVRIPTLKLLLLYLAYHRIPSWIQIQTHIQIQYSTIRGALPKANSSVLIKRCLFFTIRLDLKFVSWYMERLFCRPVSNLFMKNLHFTACRTTKKVNLYLEWCDEAPGTRKRLASVLEPNDGGLDTMYMLQSNQ